MGLNHTLSKPSLVSIAWILAIAATGLVASVESLMGWLVVSVLAFGAPAVLLHSWKELPRITSHSIQGARR